MKLVPFICVFLLNLLEQRVRNETNLFYMNYVEIIIISNGMYVYIIRSYLLMKCN